MNDRNEMKEKLGLAIGMIDDTFIEEAAGCDASRAADAVEGPGRRVVKSDGRRVRGRSVKWRYVTAAVSAAAVLILVAVLSIPLIIGPSFSTKYGGKLQPGGYVPASTSSFDENESSSIGESVRPSVPSDKKNESVWDFADVTVLYCWSENGTYKLIGFPGAVIDSRPGEPDHTSDDALNAGLTEALKKPLTLREAKILYSGNPVRVLPLSKLAGVCPACDAFLEGSYGVGGNSFSAELTEDEIAAIEKEIAAE